MSILNEQMTRLAISLPRKEHRTLLDEMKARVSDDAIKVALANNPRYRPLMKSIDWALKRNEKKRLENFKNELYELIEKMRTKLAHSLMARLEEKGRAIEVMSEEDAVKYMQTKNATMVSYELLHSLTLDISNFYNREGFDFEVEEVTANDPILQLSSALHEVLDKQLTLRYEGTTITPEIKRLMEEESDRVYAYTMKRMEFFHKRAQEALGKHYAKLQKEKEKAEKELEKLKKVNE